MAQVIAGDSTGSAGPAPLPLLSDNRPTTRWVVIWGIAASLLLVGSGLVRSVQSKFYQEENPYQIQSPFPLAEMPKTLDGWHLVEGSSTVLDPLTTRITGSTDHAIGNYIDELTGATVSFMILYGPAEPVLPHIPEVCYPSSGYKAAGSGADRDLSVTDKPAARFRTNVFVKSGGRSLLQEVVYYSFRHDGVWVPWINTRNTPRKNPGIYKVQVLRRMVPGESLGQEEPIEEFLRKMLPALERKIADTAVAPTKVAATP